MKTILNGILALLFVLTSICLLGQTRNQPSVTAEIHVASFEVLLEDGHARVVWKAQNEQSLKYYVIQRSQNAEVWKDAALMPKQQAVAGIKTYLFIDNIPVHHRTYYRIVSVMQDGSYLISAQNSVAVGDTLTQRPLVYPDMAPSGKYVIEIEEIAPTHFGLLRIFDVSGHLLLQQTLLPSEGSNVKLETDLASGSYVMQYINGPVASQTEFLLGPAL